MARADVAIAGDGVRLCARDHGGTGSPVILLHGLARNLEDWGAVVPFLVAEHRVVAIDLRGHGRSSDGPWSWSAAVSDVTAVIDQLDLQRPAIVGHSLGGMIAALCAADVDAVAASINLDGHGLRPSDHYDGFDPDTVRARLAELRALGATMLPNTEPMSDEQVRHLVGAARAHAAAQNLPEDVIEAVVTRSLEPGEDGGSRFKPAAAVVNRILDLVEELDLIATYRRAARPLLVVSADRRDPSTDAYGLPWLPDFLTAQRAGVQRDLAAVARDVDMVSVQSFDGTHGLLLEEPELVARTINTFLA